MAEAQGAAVQVVQAEAEEAAEAQAAPVEAEEVAEAQAEAVQVLHRVAV